MSTTPKRVLKFDSLSTALTATTQKANLAESAAIEAASAAGVDSAYISFDKGVLPDTSITPDPGVIGAYFTNDNVFQRVEWNGSEWQNVGIPIPTKEYVDNLINEISDPPDYTQPSAVMNNFSPSTIEQGDAINQVFELTYNNDLQTGGGNATEFRFKVDGNLEATLTEIPATYTFISNPVSNVQIIGEIDYEDGVILNNSVTGQPDERGRILAGTVTITRTLNVRQLIFFGSVASTPVTSADARVLNSVFDNETSVDLVTGTTNRRFVCLVPSSMTISNVNDVGNLNLDITSDYQLTNSNFTINNPTGSPMTYKLYVFEADNPYNPSTTHKITFS